MPFGRWPKPVLVHTCTPSEVGSVWAAIVSVQ